MWLTKNEKKVLKLLVDDAKLSDTFIANKLNVSSQAVGRIRKKLEEEIIKGYTLELDYEKLDLNLLVLGRMHINNEGIEYGKDKIEKEIINYPNCFNFFSTFSNKPSHVFMSLFKDMNELKESCTMLEKGEFRRLMELDEIIQLPITNILKMSSRDVLNNAIDKLGIKTTKINLRERKYIS